MGVGVGTKNEAHVIFVETQATARDASQTYALLSLGGCTLEALQTAQRLGGRIQVGFLVLYRYFALIIIHNIACDRVHGGVRVKILRLRQLVVARVELGDSDFEFGVQTVVRGGHQLENEEPVMEKYPADEGAGDG